MVVLLEYLKIFEKLHVMSSQPEVVFGENFGSSQNAG
jgi:hypothetical protein